METIITEEVIEIRPAKRRAILVTGASGYIGRLVVQRLAKDVGVSHLIASDLRSVPESERLDGVIYRELDIRNEEAVHTTVGEFTLDAVIHLAAVVTPPKGADHSLAWAVDVLGTRHVLDACVAHGVPQIVVTSSGAAYGYHPDNSGVIGEDTPLRGNEVFAYSHHKRLVEMMLAEYRQSHPELKQLIFRPGTILGENTKNQITDIFERPVVLGIKGASAPFVFIWDQDVVSCIQEGVLNNREGIFNLAGSGAMPLSEIASALHKRYLALPAQVVQGALGVLDRLGVSPYGPEQVLFLQYRPVLDNRKLREEFGFEPLSSREVFELYKKRKHEN